MRRSADEGGGLQWPCGTLIRSRLPRGARPWRRAILVEASVSSMNTSRLGSRSSWLSNQACLRLRTSGRSCSAACPVFFERDLVTLEEPPQRRDPPRPPARPAAPAARPAGCRLGLHQTQGQRRVRLDPPPLARPADRARDAHPEPLRRLATRQTIVHRRHHPIPKIHRQWSTHARQHQHRPPG